MSRDTEATPSSGAWSRVAAGLVLSQVAMAASAACLVFASARTLELSISPWWYAAAFLGSWCVYLRDSAASCDAEDAISQPRRAAIFRDDRRWSWWLPATSALAGAGCIVMARPHPWTWILLGIVGLLGLLHAAPLGRREGPGFSTKRFAAVKSVVVSVAWSVAAVGLPLLESGAAPERTTIVAGGWLVVLLTPVLLADSLLLDLRDRAADQAFDLRTIAVRIGARGVHATVAILLAGSALAALLGASDAVDPERWRRVAIATVLGLAIPWFNWRMIRRGEVATASWIMAWRFVAVLAVL